MHLKLTIDGTHSNSNLKSFDLRSEKKINSACSAFQCRKIRFRASGVEQHIQKHMYVWISVTRV